MNTLFINNIMELSILIIKNVFKLKASWWPEFTDKTTSEITVQVLNFTAPLKPFRKCKWSEK